MSKRMNNFAIAGLGITPMGRIYGKTAAGFAQEAVQLAAADAGINVADIDGLLINSPGDLNVQLQKRLGLRNTKLLARQNFCADTAAKGADDFALNRCIKFATDHTLGLGGN